MSHELHEGTLYVTRLTGPASMGDDRALWQFTLPLDRDWVQLERAEVIEVVTAIANDLGGEVRGLR